MKFSAATALVIADEVTESRPPRGVRRSGSAPQVVRRGRGHRPPMFFGIVAEQGNEK